MIERWEYMTVYWIYSTRGQTTKQPRWKGEFTLSRPGQKPETRLGYSSSDREAETVSLEELLNELGGEGWEAISETVVETTIVNDASGWKESGMPIQIRWLLKRRAA